MHLMYILCDCTMLAPLVLSLSFGAHAQRELMVVVLCVCVCVCLCVCYSNICSTAAFWLKVSVFGNNIVFSLWISLKAFHSKVMAKELLFCCAGTIGPTTTEGPF